MSISPTQIAVAPAAQKVLNSGQREIEVIRPLRVEEATVVHAGFPHSI